jgi:hypothetical protein
MAVVERRPADVINLRNLRTKFREFKMGAMRNPNASPRDLESSQVSIYCEDNRAALSNLRPYPRQIYVTQSRLIGRCRQAFNRVWRQTGPWRARVRYPDTSDGNSWAFNRRAACKRRGERLQCCQRLK